MSSPGPPAALDALTTGYDAVHWELLGAIAIEQVLGPTLLERVSRGLSASDSKGPSLTPWLVEAANAGLLTPAPALRWNGFGAPGIREAGFSVTPVYQQLVLRRLAAEGALRRIAGATRAVLGLRSTSAPTLALQFGGLEEFQRCAALTQRALDARPNLAAEWLRASTCEPFDREWFERRWAGDAIGVAARVLEESLARLAPCDDLLQWLSEFVEQNAAADAVVEHGALLCQHALLRGDSERAKQLFSQLPVSVRLELAAAVRYASGSVSEAQGCIDASLGLQPSGAPNPRRLSIRRAGLGHAKELVPLYALLLAARDSEAASVAAQRCLGKSAKESARGGARAIRQLLRYRSQPEIEHRRLDVHQLDPDASAWETLIVALTVHLHSQDKWTRAGWSQHLAKRALQWRRSGYAWIARQAFSLAATLSAEYLARELEAQGEPAESAGERGELVIWELFSPKPEWKKLLEALGRVSQEIAGPRQEAQRVVWFVELPSAVLRAPALQQLRAGEGWSDGRRVNLPELWQMRSELPPEDLRVLECSTEPAAGEREFTPEAYEALIGHPRVMHGARGREPVEVVRGSCRVETHEELGHVRVSVEPEGAELGVNVRVEGEKRLVVYRMDAALHRVLQTLPRGLSVPLANERELLGVLGRLAESVEVRSAALGSKREMQADARPCLRFAHQAGAWLVQLGVRPFGEQGRFFLCGQERANLSIFVDGVSVRIERDLPLERENRERMLLACPTLVRSLELEARSPLEPEDSWVLGEVSVLQVLAELRDANFACALEWPEGGGMRLAAHVTTRSLHGRLRSEKGWYIATGGVRLDAVTEASLSELVRAPALASGRFLRLPNGDYVEVESRIRRVIAALKAASSSRRGSDVRVPKSALFTLSELAAAGADFELDTSSVAWLERVKQLASQTFEVPPELRAELRPYQVEGFRWLACLSELGLGACLADDMGLGKTLQILALLLRRTAEGPALVVAPTSVCGNWCAEIRRFAPSLRIVEYVGKERMPLLAKLEAQGSGCVVICSYTLLQQDADALKALCWGTLVLDEAQFIKNPHSLRARAAYRLEAKQRVVATGTPVENHYGDIWSLFHFLNPGLLGDFADFSRGFVRPLERGDAADAIEALRALIRPFILRRTKREVLADLPPLTEVQHEIRFSPDEAMRYALLRKQIHEKLYTSWGKRNHKLEVLAEIMRLRRFCCHPALVFPDAPRECSKVEAFLNLVEDLRQNGHRALVFSQFVDFLTLLREQLEERGVSYEYLDGSTPQAERQGRVESFQNGRADLFLISLKAGGFGLNLSAADYVIHLDPWWNPAVQAQATDRAHRIGQLRAVTVYRLIVRESIEDSIVQLHADKRLLADSLLEGGEQTGKLSTEELVALLGARTN